MIHALCKLFLLAHRRPWWVLAATAILVALCVKPIQKLEFQKSFTELLPDDIPSVAQWKKAGRQFGGLGNLTLLFHSSDPEKNERAVHYAVENLSRHPDVNFLEWRTEADFYRQHQLLYVQLDDLKEVEHRIQNGFWLARKKRNPLILDLLGEEEKSSLMDATGFQDLEQKYFANLKSELGNRDGTIRLVRIYPAFDITDIEKGRAFLRDIETLVDEMRSTLSEGTPGIHMTGELLNNVNQEGRLYSHLLDSGKYALSLGIALFLLTFMRLPLGALLALIPILIAFTWTMALASLIWGHLSLISAPLGLLLSGFGLDGAIKLLDRYREERRKRLSAPVAFETLVLETGPAILTGMLLLGAVSLALVFTRFKGVAEFGIFAALGMLCLVFAVLLVFPCLLMVVEPTGLLHAFGKRLYNFDRFKSRPFKHWPWLAGITALLTVASLVIGPQRHFELRLDKLGFRNPDTLADSLLQASGEALGDPAFFLSATLAESQTIAEILRTRKVQDTLSPTLGDITTLEDLLPARQNEKMEIISRLRQTITPEIISTAPEPLRTSLRKLEANWPSGPLTVEDLPINYRHKFQGQNKESGYFTYVFPSIDPKLGLNNVAFAEDLKGIRIDGRLVNPSGRAVLYADLLSLIIPDTKTIGLAALLILILLVFLDVRSLRATILLVTPFLLGLLWTLASLTLLRIPLNHFNLAAFPACLTMALCSSLLIYHRYLEEGRGSILFVMNRCAPTLILCSLVGVATFAALPFSDHQGLRSLGISAIIGLFMAQMATFLFVPAFIAYLEARTLAKTQGDMPSEIWTTGTPNRAP